MAITALAVGAVRTPFNEPGTHLCHRIRLTRGEGHSLFQRTCSACTVPGRRFTNRRRIRADDRLHLDAHRGCLNLAGGGRPASKAEVADIRSISTGPD